MVRILFQRQSNLQAGQYHSTAISLLRGMAALQVAAAHLRAQLYVGFRTVAHPPLAFQAMAFVTGFAHLAVVVFFVLSGWLVGGSLLNKTDTPGALGHYAVDRVSRLWIVLVPTFAVIVLLRLLAGWLDPSQAEFSAAGEYSLGAFLGNLVGLQRLLVPPFGGDFPLWSLSNETWYYVLFPLLVTVFWSRLLAARIAAIAAMLVIAHLLTNAILLYFTIWLLGAACTRVRLETTVLVRCLFIALFAGLAAYFRLKGKSDGMDSSTFVQDFVFSIALVLVLCSMQYRPAQQSKRIRCTDSFARLVASFSFTLYVIHVPLIGEIGHFTRAVFQLERLSPYRPAHYLVYLTMYAFLVLAAYLFHLPFEANTQRLRRWIKSLLFGQAIAPT